MVDVEEDVGVDVRMAVIGEGVLGERRIGFGRELAGDLPESEGQGGEGQPGDDQDGLLHGLSFEPAIPPAPWDN